MPPRRPTRTTSSGRPSAVAPIGVIATNGFWLDRRQPLFKVGKTVRFHTRHIQLGAGHADRQPYAVAGESIQGDGVHVLPSEETTAAFNSFATEPGRPL